VFLNAWNESFLRRSSAARTLPVTVSMRNYINTEQTQ
jgi:hypothetical protein